MANYVMTYELILDSRAKNKIDSQLNIASNVYNELLSVILKRYNKLRNSSEHRKLLKSYINVKIKLENLKLNKKNTQETKEKFKKLSEIKKTITEKLKQIRLDYGFSEYELHKYCKTINKKNNYDFNSMLVQKLATRAFKSVEKLMYNSKTKKVKFKKLGTASFEGKNNKTGLRYDLSKNELIISRKIKCKLKMDAYQMNCFKDKICYCRMLPPRIIRNRKRYYVQIIFEGVPPLNYIPNENKVGIDIGTSTVAIAGKNAVKLETLSNTEKEKNKIRRLQRSITRKNIANNISNFNENGTIKKLPKGQERKWIISKRETKVRNKLKDIYRKKKVKDTEHKYKLANEILNLGNDIKVEEMNFSALSKRSRKTSVNIRNGKFKCKKRFGKSISENAPAKLLAIIIAKLEYIGKKIEKIDTRKAKASQYNHIKNEYRKAGLEIRYKELDNNIIVQRDLYSAYLIKNIENRSEYNRFNLTKGFDNFMEMHNRELERLKDNKKLKFYINKTSKNTMTYCS